MATICRFIARIGDLLPRRAAISVSARFSCVTRHGPPARQQDHPPGPDAQLTLHPEWVLRFPGSGRLQGKTAVVAGGDSGIGRAATVLFAREGANVATLYKDEHQDAGATLAMIRTKGAEGIALPGVLSARKGQGLRARHPEGTARQAEQKCSLHPVACP